MNKTGEVITDSWITTKIHGRFVGEDALKDSGTPERGTSEPAEYNRPMPFLVKEEPTHYSFDQFVKDRGTTWSGVKNPLAQKHLRSIKKGDLVFYYHTGDEKAIVGIAKASGNAYPDPADAAGKAHVVDLVPVKKLSRPVTLGEIKADKTFSDFALTYMPRLSVMPVTEKQWDLIVKISAQKS